MRSGEAPARNHEEESALRAIWACVRGLKLGLTCVSPRVFSRAFSRTATQFPHPQFHCGKPPPAAEPRILMCIFEELEFCAHVGVDFAAENYFFENRAGPNHDRHLRNEEF